MYACEQMFGKQILIQNLRTYICMHVQINLRVVCILELKLSHYVVTYAFYEKKLFFVLAY